MARSKRESREMKNRCQLDWRGEFTRMVQTRRVGMQNEGVQLPNALRFSPTIVRFPPSRTDFAQLSDGLYHSNSDPLSLTRVRKRLKA